MYVYTRNRHNMYTYWIRILNVIQTYFQHKFWQTQELAGELFIVGDNKFYGKTKNCPLQPKELYEIIVILAEGNESFYNEQNILKILIRDDRDEVPSMYHEKWIIPIILIIIGVAIALYFYGRWYNFIPIYFKKWRLLSV